MQELRYFALTAQTAAHGFKVSAIGCYDTVRLAWMIATSPEARRLYHSAWIAFLIVCCAIWWLTHHAYRITRLVIDPIVEESLAADAPELPTVKSEVKAIALTYWEYIRSLIGGIAESYRLAWRVAQAEAKAAFSG